MTKMGVHFARCLLLSLLVASAVVASDVNQEDLDHMTTCFNACLNNRRSICFREEQARRMAELFPNRNHQPNKAERSEMNDTVKRHCANEDVHDFNYGCFHGCTAQHLAEGRQVFKLNGRWPFTRVWIFTEPLSALFAAISVVAFLYYLLQYRRAVSEYWERRHTLGVWTDNTAALGLCPGYRYHWCWHLYWVAWACTFFFAVIFHTVDTPLTEALDYFSAFIAASLTLFIAVVRIFRLTTLRHVLLLLAATLVFITQHIVYMAFVDFNYGYNVMVVGALIAVHFLLWVWWACTVEDAPHRWVILQTLGILFVLVPLEIRDFPPVWGYVDAHCLWHGGMIAVGLLWTRFLIADATIGVASSCSRVRGRSASFARLVEGGMEKAD
eukprot:TRINITY_DN468_c2_g1_i2.p1 TRINITY_DN468_c2_g1~~TRINITY_DN468_c2_g1_i2.p1  ORF type:complete len:384 (+),score=36.63 TRINITY_DN468_c2_g1_i2:160-1311(+)